MKEFNVIINEFNTGKFVPFNVLPYLLQCYKKTKKKPKTFEEFKNFIIDESRYQWWSRTEYEIVLEEWPTTEHNKKIDVFWQIMLNIDLVVRLIMEELKIKI